MVPVRARPLQTIFKHRPIHTTTPTHLPALPARQKTPHEVLRLHRGASQAEIKDRSMALMKRYHPDHTNDPASRAEFELVLAAYRTLSNPSSPSSSSYQSPFPSRPHSHRHTPPAPPHVHPRRPPRPRPFPDEYDDYDDHDRPPVEPGSIPLLAIYALALALLIPLSLTHVHIDRTIHNLRPPLPPSDTDFPLSLLCPKGDQEQREAWRDILRRRALAIRSSRPSPPASPSPPPDSPG